VHTLLKYVKNVAIAYSHKTDMPHLYGIVEVLDVVNIIVTDWLALFHLNIVINQKCMFSLVNTYIHIGIVELCAKILQIMRNDFKDYARTCCQLCAPFSVLYYT